MDRIILQVPMSKTLKEQAEKVARDEGFSSLQEIVRMILSKFAKKEIKVGIYEEKAEYVQLSPAAKKRYSRMRQDFKLGHNVFPAKSVKELLQQLES